MRATMQNIRDLQQEIMSELSKLDLESQKQVMDLIKTLSPSKPKGVHGEKLLSFAGVIPAEDLNEMAQAIKECDRVDLNEW